MLVFTRICIKKINNTIVQKKSRQQLCDLLMCSVQQSFQKYGIQNIKSMKIEKDSTNHINQGLVFLNK